MRASIYLRKIFRAWENITNKDTEEQMTIQGKLGRDTRGQTFKAMHKAQPSSGWRQGPTESFGEGDRKEVPGVFGVCPES